MFTIKHSLGRLVVRGCTPHYRRPLVEIVDFRRQMAAQLREQKVELPISAPIKISLLAKRHCEGGDLANVLQGLIQALDGNTLGKTDAILADDSQITRLHAQWI